MVAALAFVGCAGIGLWPYQTEISNANFRSYDAVQTAYEAITPGLTRQSDLGALGFDAGNSPNVKVLSFLGVMERFMPRDSIKFDELDPAVKACIEARDSCSAYVFRPQQHDEARDASWLFDSFASDQMAGRAGWSAEVVLLIQRGRVAYKFMPGQPRMDGNIAQPIDSVQDFGSAAVHEARTAATF